MKRIITLLSVVLAFNASSQIEGMWKLAPQQGALAVGTTEGSGSLWSNPLSEVTSRACLFDDSISFDASGNMIQYMDGSTWIEEWQGSNPPACGAPVAPHDGTTNAPYTYVYDSGAGTLTVNGVGAHLGLPKAVNGSEINSSANAPASITYNVSFVNNNNTMIADINCGASLWWRFIYQRTNAVNAPNPMVTFQVDMSDYSGTASLANGVYINGSYNNWVGSGDLMTNIGNNIWEITLEIPVGNIQFIYNIDNYADFEGFSASDACIDPFDDGFYNRYYEVTSDATLPVVCFNSCEACVTGIEGNDISFFNVYPNPSNSAFNISSENNFDSIILFDLSGKVIFSDAVDVKEYTLNLTGIFAGTYIMEVTSDKGTYRKEVVVL